MTADALRILADALRLSEQDRADVASRLFESLERDADAEWASTWGAELRRRIEELDRGEVKTVPWQEARRIIVGKKDDTAPP